MNKFFILASIAMLLSAASAYADPQATATKASTIMAFQNVESALVSPDEMNIAGGAADGLHLLTTVSTLKAQTANEEAISSAERKVSK